MLILVVDDEPQIRKLLKTGLEGYGYQVITAANGQEALTAAAQRAPELIILDIALGSEPDGVEVCRRLREWSQVPIIMLSVRGDEKTKVMALDAGADDYLTKPFGMEELRARMQAVLRRVALEPSSSPAAVVRAGALEIDLANRRVTVAGVEVHLTPIEYDILRLLATHPGKIMTHQSILAGVWGPEYRDMTHYVRIYVNQIRKKLGENPAANVRYILNEPGIGYRFIDVE
ncbi:MAG: response regulator transcription factor [Chloroflexi bacterium]|nr:response regulator transcription factor [Chloroflexota bacterium]MCI0575276.1 response regulator transcription factor [Chloroflexota bacterium]MCI0645722.1 response regulator transcription factor [Chloroflexota bacterium]MCI0730127.1 response regulator transcription factor [Chloroflexota bacterium]